MTLWLSVRVAYENTQIWELNGIFDSEEKAVAACTQPNDGVCSLPLNHRAPEEPTFFPGLYYPLETR